MKTKRGAAGNLLCSHHVNHQQVLALATAPPLASCTLSVTTPRTSGRHHPRGAVDTCRRPGLFRQPKRHRIAAQICRVDRPLFSLTCTATAATTTASIPGKRTHSVHNYLSLAISNLPIALAVGYHRRLAHRVSPYPSAHHHQCYCACCAVRYHQVVWFAHDDYRCRNGCAPPLSWR